MFEHASVYDALYGTPKKYIEQIIHEEQQDVLCNLDSQGAMSIKMKNQMIQFTIFLLPPSINELYNRMLKRGDNKKSAKNRIQHCMEDLSHAIHYDYVLINDDFDTCLSNLQSIIFVERLKRKTQYSISLDIKNIINNNT